MFDKNGPSGSFAIICIKVERRQEKPFFWPRLYTKTTLAPLVSLRGSVCYGRLAELLARSHKKQKLEPYQMGPQDLS
jgi:hypothetical protein